MPYTVLNNIKARKAVDNFPGIFFEQLILFSTKKKSTRQGALFLGFVSLF